MRKRKNKELSGIEESEGNIIPSSSDSPVTPEITPEFRDTVGGYDPDDVEVLRRFLVEFKMKPEELCEELDYGSVTLIKNYLNGTQAMVNPFKNKFMQYVRRRRKPKPY